MQLIFNRIISLEPFTMFMYLFMFVSCIVFPIIRNILVKMGKSLKIWVICSFIPMIVCVVHLLLNLYDKNESVTFELFGLAYIASVFFPLMMPLCRKKVLFHVSAVLCSVLIFCCTFVSMATLSALYVRTLNYSRMSMTESYKAVINDMKTYYPLSEWKGIDYEKINSEIYPMVEEAEKNNDYVLFSHALDRLTYLIPDGHVGYMPTQDSEQSAKLFDEMMKNNYYGFVMFTNDDGKTRAFAVDEESDAYKSGIHSGTVITEWDGKNITQALAETKDYIFYDNYAVKENEDFILPLCLSGIGGDETEVGFIDGSGNHQKAKIKKTDVFFMNGYEAYNRIMSGNNENENFSSKMIADDVGYLRINEERYDNVLDIKAYIFGNYPEVEDRVKKELDSLKAKGMKKLVIDLRYNAGGNPYISTAVASVFSDKKATVLTLAGTMVNKANIEIKLSGDGTYKDLPVVVLVNSRCGSSGDILADIMRKFDNVKLVGMTPSMGIGQCVGERCMLPGGCEFAFPIILTYNENGEINVDTKGDRISRIPLDEKIPSSEELIRAILEGGGDAELDYVTEHFF